MNSSMNISGGVAALLANAHTPAPSGEYYTFEGDLCQMAKAVEVAHILWCQVGISGGLPYVKYKEDYDMVIQHIVAHKIEGYWHYT